MGGSYRVELCNLSVCQSFLLKADQIALWVCVWFGLVLIVWQIVCFLISSSISICFLLEVSSSR